MFTGSRPLGGRKINEITQPPGNRRGNQPAKQNTLALNAALMPERNRTFHFFADRVKSTLRSHDNMSACSHGDIRAPGNPGWDRFISRNVLPSQAPCE